VGLKGGTAFELRGYHNKDQAGPFRGAALGRKQKACPTARNRAFQWTDMKTKYFPGSTKKKGENTEYEKKNSQGRGEGRGKRASVPTGH